MTNYFSWKQLLRNVSVFFLLLCPLAHTLIFSFSIHCNVSACTLGSINFHHEIYVFVIFVKYTFSKMVWDNVWFSYGVVKFHTYAESIGKVKKDTLFTHIDYVCIYTCTYVHRSIYSMATIHQLMNFFKLNMPDGLYGTHICVWIFAWNAIAPKIVAWFNG